MAETMVFKKYNFKIYRILKLKVDYKGKCNSDRSVFSR